MRDFLTDSLLAEFSEFIASRTALYFPEPRWRDLERKACSAARELEFADTEEFVRWVLSSSLSHEQMEVLASHLTINETYFWREPLVFEALEERILPELIHVREKNDRRLRIWSAGCSTGEEAYSIAIALRRALPALSDWNVTILATDINPKMLRKAAEGVYGDWSFRNAPHWLTGTYFRRTRDGKREILPEIREMVKFAYLNLAEDPFPTPSNNTNAMDLVFCRNVLMYFAPEHIREIGQNLHGALLENGWLVVGASELSQQLFPQFAPVHFPGAIVYRKEQGVQHLPVAFDLKTPHVQESFVPEPLKPSVEVEGHAPPIEMSTLNIIPFMAPPAMRPIANLPAVFPAEAEIHDGPIVPPADTSSIRLFANQGRLDEALVSCDEAITGNKLSAGLHYLRATILQELEREDDAITSLKRALYLDPDFVLAHFALGNLAIRQKQARKARRCFENVLALLSMCREDEILPESEGLTAGRFREIIHAIMQMGALA